MNDRLISVIIPAYNEEKNIKRSLDSIVNQKLLGEVIVVDDHSTDRTPEILKEYENRGKIKIVRNKKNLGISKSVNIGLKNAKYDYVCLMKADYIVPDRWLEKQFKLLDKNVAGVYSSLVLPKDEWERFNFWNKLFHSKFLKPKKTMGNMGLFKKDVLEKIGMFSKDFRVAGEDFDFHLRLKRNGYRTVFCNCLVQHLMGSHNIGFKNYFVKELQYGEARGAILRKHRFLIPFNPFAFRISLDSKLFFGLPIVIFLRTFVHFIGFWKGFVTGKQTW